MGYNVSDDLVPLAKYISYSVIDKLIFISGQLPLIKGEIFSTGKIGKEINMEEAKKSIKIATVNLLLVLNKLAIENNINPKEIKCINIKGYLNCIESFSEHSKLFNTSSDLIIDVLGETHGSHSRSVIGVYSLPLNSPIEIDGTFSILK